MSDLFAALFIGGWGVLAVVLVVGAIRAPSGPGQRVPRPVRVPRAARPVGNRTVVSGAERGPW